jgi:hypothetical protein
MNAPEQGRLYAVKSLNFYSAVYHANLLNRKKVCTIRLGDKTDKYRDGDVVLVTYGDRFKPRRELFRAVLDLVEVKRLADLSERDIRGENPDMRTTEDVVSFLEKIYERTIDPSEPATVIYFSEITK